MAKYLIIDTESTIKDHCADFAAVIYDSKRGVILNSCAILVTDFFSKEPLFHNQDGGYFAQERLKKRTDIYLDMLESGKRSMASVNAINRWLAQAYNAYPDLIFTAYNINFDINICANSGILIPPIKSFCLWNLCCKLFANRKGYIKYAIKNKAFTTKSNMKTNAEVMFRYLYNCDDYIEPHTALEDIVTAELPILKYCLRQKKGIKADPYSWKKFQLPIVVERLGIQL